MWPRYGVRYPSGAVHVCPFGRDQAFMICPLAQRYLDWAEVVAEYGDGTWRGMYK